MNSNLSAEEDSSGILVRFSAPGLEDEILPQPPLMDARSSFEDETQEEETAEDPPPQEVDQQFSNFCNNPELSDIVLEILPSGQKFNAHKLILSMTSPFFKTMFFSSHWSSKEKHCVKVWVISDQSKKIKK